MSSVNRRTIYTTIMMMLGREINLPTHLMFVQAQRSTKDDDTDGYVAQLSRNTQTAHETARSELKTSIRRMKRDYELRILQRSYEEDDLVYVLGTASKKANVRSFVRLVKAQQLLRISGSLFRVKLKKCHICCQP